MVSPRRSLAIDARDVAPSVPQRTYPVVATSVTHVTVNAISRTFDTRTERITAFGNVCARATPVAGQYTPRATANRHANTHPYRPALA